MRRFWHVYRPFVDEWTLHYSGREGILLVAEGKDDNYSVVRDGLYIRFKEQVS